MIHYLNYDIPVYIPVILFLLFVFFLIVTMTYISWRILNGIRHDIDELKAGIIKIIDAVDFDKHLEKGLKNLEQRRLAVRLLNEMLQKLNNLTLKFDILTSQLLDLRKRVGAVVSLILNSDKTQTQKIYRDDFKEKIKNRELETLESRRDQIFDLIEINTKNLHEIQKSIAERGTDISVKLMNQEDGLMRTIDRLRKELRDVMLQIKIEKDDE